VKQVKTSREEHAQEQLDRRLDHGEKGRRLVEWLNSLPGVQAVVAAEFGGKAIPEQNISEWRKTGYKKWLRQQEALDMARQLAADTGELQPAGAPPLTDQMAVWLAARYLIAIRKLGETSDGAEPDLKVLREFCHDVVALRRGDHSAARLKLEQERLEREREENRGGGGGGIRAVGGKSPGARLDLPDVGQAGGARAPVACNFWPAAGAAGGSGPHRAPVKPSQTEFDPGSSSGPEQSPCIPGPETGAA
jgi:hypothetical protein